MANKPTKSEVITQKVDTKLTVANEARWDQFKTKVRIGKGK